MGKKVYGVLVFDLRDIEHAGLIIVWRRAARQNKTGMDLSRVHTSANAAVTT